jgi:hypothetical protein
MDTDQLALTDTTILDSVDSVVQKQIKCNKLLDKMASQSQLDSPATSGANKVPLGPLRQQGVITLAMEQSQQNSFDNTVDTPNNVSLNSLMDKFNGFHVAEPSKPKYLSPADIVQHFNELNMSHQKDLYEMQKTMQMVLKHIARLEKDPPEENKKLYALLQKAEQSSGEAFGPQELGLQIAKEVASYYSTPIELLQEKQEANDWKPLINYKSHGEITTATGYFDPAEKGADFAKTWLVLTHYGQSNYFKQSNYKQALFYICKGEAKTTLIEFERSKKSLQDIITHFGSIYSKKCLLVADRKVRENFVRQKGESLEICLQSI